MNEENRTTQKRRLVGFAIGHVVVSGATALITWSLLMAGTLLRGSWLGLFLLILCSMLAYFPAGMLIAKIDRWALPADTGEARRAMLTPACIAWGWVVIVVAMVTFDFLPIFAVVLYISMFFAAPSSLWVLMVMYFLDAVGLPGSISNGPLGMALGGLLAGVLPPVLFAQGSFFQSGRMARAEVSLPPAEPKE